MTKDQLIKDCLNLGEGCVVDYPYGPTVEVLKNNKGKSFALVGFLAATDIASIKKNCCENVPMNESDIFITLKCSPELIPVFRQKYLAVIPGYYSNKNHWNTIIVDKDVPHEELIKMVQLSYDLVTPNKK